MGKPRIVNVKHQIMDEIATPALPLMAEMATTMASSEYSDETTPPPASKSPSSFQQRPRPSHVSLDAILAELQAYRDENDGSLDVPTSHPLLVRIADALAPSVVVGSRGGGEVGGGGIGDDEGRRWDENMAELRAYKVRHGNCNVPPGASGRWAALAGWTAEQRVHYDLYERQRPSPLTGERYEQLRELGLTVNPWEGRLDELRAYRAQHGDCDVPIAYPGLGLWVLNQRDAYHFERDVYPQDRIDKLEALGFNWNRWGRNRLKVREEAWDTQFAKLVEFMEVNGHSNISQHDKDNERLGKWIKNQRYEYRKYHNKGLGPSRLGKDRIEKLNEIGFQWRLRPERVPWEERFNALVEFKEAHGHCRVPMNVPELGKWAKYQRDQYVLRARGKKAKITKEKIDMLTSIGFEDSLEERVALGLPGEHGGGGNGGGLLDDEQHGQQDEDHLLHDGVAYEHNGEPHAEHYLHGDASHVYGCVHSAQPDSDAVNYQHYPA